MSESKIYGRIYKITNLVNGKVYIGQTIKSVKHRFARHMKGLDADTTYLSKAVQEFGRGKFSIEIISEAHSKDELDEQERYFIKSYDSKNLEFGYNYQNGGQKHGGFPHKEEDKFNLRKTAMESKGYQGVCKDKKVYIATLVVSGKNYIVYGIKNFNDALEIRDMMAKYYLGKYAVLNFPGSSDADIPPLSINDCRKYLRFLQEKILYNGVCRRHGRYGVRIKVWYVEKVSLTFKTQIDAAYVFDYYNRFYNFDNDAINFPDVILTRDEMIEIVIRNKGSKGKEVDYSRL